MTEPTRHPQSARFHGYLRELGALHDKKQRDYGRDADPFSNVRASEEWGIQGWVGAMIRLHDKVRRLQRAATGGTLVNEGVIDSLNDIAVYAMIARALYEEAQGAPATTPRSPAKRVIRVVCPTDHGVTNLPDPGPGGHVALCCQKAHVEYAEA
jgi:hypothetical protein